MTLEGETGHKFHKTLGAHLAPRLPKVCNGQLVASSLRRFLPLQDWCSSRGSSTQTSHKLKVQPHHWHILNLCCGLTRSMQAMHSTGRPKRPRALQACEVCRQRKNRCSEDRPCTYCVGELVMTYVPILRDSSRSRRARPRMYIRARSPRQAAQTRVCANLGFILVNWLTRLSRSIEEFRQQVMSGAINLFSSESNEQTTTDELPVHQPLPIAVVQSQRNGTTSTSSNIEQDTPSTVAPTSTSDVIDTNLHTSNREFYGSASSVAFLRNVEILSNGQSTGPISELPERSLASRLHNTDFQPDTSPCVPVAPTEATPKTERFHFRVARRFLDSYFSNIHHIQPLFEEEEFLARCEDLWFDRAARLPLSFVALYYATLSLGSLVMTIDNPEVCGSDRFTWSRRLFNDALALVTQLGMKTDLEMVQCYYMMSKICQHELNPHVAYLYSGQAARTSLAIGINRSPIGPGEADSRASMAASRTWWAVYCLDIQTSFALGRPDSLGPDQYHTQFLPTATPGTSYPPKALQIVPCMIGLSQLMRKVALELYTQPCDMEQKVQKAKSLSMELELWLEQIPSHLRYEQPGTDFGLKSRRSASYIKKQSVVLRLRYLNLRMVIHAVFMVDAKSFSPAEADLLRGYRCPSIQSAEETINLIYSTFGTDDYFQTWYVFSATKKLSYCTRSLFPFG